MTTQCPTCGQEVKRILQPGSPEYIAMMAKADEESEQLYRERVAKRLAKIKPKEKTDVPQAQHQLRRNDQD